MTIDPEIPLINKVAIYHLVMTNIAMERSSMFKFGKPSMSMGHGLTMAMLVITRG